MIGENMRVMIVNTYYYPEIMGGAEYSVKKLAEGLKKAGHNVLVLCTGEIEGTEIIDGIDVHRFVPKNICRSISISGKTKMKKAIHRLEELWNCKNRRILIKTIKEFAPDVIHTNGLYDITPVVWKIAKEENIRIVHTVRDYYLMCPRVALTCDKRNGRCESPTILCRLYRSINRKSTVWVDCVTAPSLNTLSTLCMDGFFLQAEKKVIPNAIDFSEELLEKNLSIRYRKPKTEGCAFVFLGTLSEQKGIKWLIESFYKVEDTNAILYIAGKGQLEEYVIEASKRDSRIKNIGFLNEQDMNSLLVKADVVVCPSLWQEPFGRVVLDAYKSGMPVITSNHGALPELVDNMVTGIVVDPDNSESLLSALRYFCKNMDQYNRFSFNAINRVRDFSVDQQIQDFVSVYKGAVGVEN